MSETMELTSLPASTLRYWEKQFEQLQPRKDRHGNRYYKQADINLIKQIRYVRDTLHITRIDAIQAQLKQPAKAVDVRQKTSETLQRLRQELIGIRNHLA